MLRNILCKFLIIIHLPIADMCCDMHIIDIDKSRLYRFPYPV